MFQIPAIGVALLKNHRDVADLLTLHKADPHFRDDRGRILFTRIISEERLTTQLVDKLLYMLNTYKPNINDQDVHGMTAVICYYDCLKSLSKLWFKNSSKISK